MVKYTPYEVFVDGESVFVYRFSTIYDKENILNKYKKEYPNRKVTIKRWSEEIAMRSH